MVKIGDIISGYRLVAELGGGGYADVYKGEHAFLKNKPVVAIKVLHPHLISPEQYNLFIQEAQLLEKLDHPYILRVLDAGIYEHSLYLITEYAPRGSLRECLQRQNAKPLPIDEAIRILSQIGYALQYAHDRNIIHCDLKPENILINADGDVLLADFGIAVVLVSGKTKEVGVRGTIHYMAPEQFDGVISPKSDQYALGCIAYELFTGRRPFMVPYPSPEIMWYQHAKVQPTPPGLLNPDLPLHIEGTMLIAIEKDRAKRYPDITTFIMALCKVMGRVRAGQALQVGEVVGGKFRIWELSEEDNRGCVYTVRQVRTVSPSYVMRQLWLQIHLGEKEEEVLRSTHKNTIECFNKEVEILQSLKHPYIPPLLSAFHEDDNYYFVTEFVPGRTLTKILEDSKRPLMEEQVIRWMIQICEAVTYIHTHDPPVILGMIEASDIMVTPDDDAKLICVGSLRRVFSRRKPPTIRSRAGRLYNHPYRSPEYYGLSDIPLDGKNKLDARSDIYSLGAIIYHLLTHDEPLMLDLPPALGSMNTKNPKLRTLQVGDKTVCPIEQVIIKATQGNPNQRFQKVQAMRNALRSCLSN